MTTKERTLHLEGQGSLGESRRHWLVAAALALMLLLPYPGFLGEGALRVVDVTRFALVAGVAGFLLLQRPPLTRETTTAILIFAAYGAWQALVIGLAALQGIAVFADAYDLYKPALFLAAFALGAASGAVHVGAYVLRLGVWLVVGATAVVGAVQYTALYGPAFYWFSPRMVEVIDRHYMGRRIIGTIGNPNFFGVLMAALLAYAFYKAVVERQRLYVALSVVLFGLIIMSQSRTALAVLLPVFLVLFIMERQKLNPAAVWRCARHGAVTCVVTSLAVGAFFYVGAGGDVHSRTLYLQNTLQNVAFLSERFEFLGAAPDLEEDRGELGGSVRLRFELWEEVLDRFRERPLLGHGPAKAYDGIRYADNTYLFTAYKYGIIGLGLALAFLWFILGRLRERFPDPAAEELRILVVVTWTALLAAGLTMDSLESLSLVSFAMALTGWLLQARRVGSYHA